MTWTILCPGPSLATVQKLSGPLVAVNGAVRADLPIEVFCTIRGPDAHKGSWASLESKRPRVWCHSFHQHLWTRAGFQAESWPWPPEIPWMPKLPLKSVFYAISACIHLGATSMDLWGCDMAHETDFDGRKAYDPSRWPREEQRMRLLREAARGNGVSIALR